MVDLKYLFVDESFEPEFWCTCYQYTDDYMRKISWQKYSILGRVSKLGDSEIGISEIVSYNKTCW